ncbi:MAG: hypothetical protein EPN85_12935 [Bacteroidetes bacterium]|nr:MAG: hypothetical protein EPN85_12935 [Bacteroidota bacterium]
MNPIISCFSKTVLALSVFTFTSCGPDSSEDSSTASQDTTAAVVNDTASPTQDFFYSLPSPLLMAKVFRKTGLKYMEGVANSPDNVSKYTSIHSKTLNLGVYSADLAYTVLNKQNQQASRYMGSIKRLSDELGMSSLFDSDDYLNRFKNNLNNEDSLITVVCELKSEMDVFMKDNEKEKQTLLIFIGAWIENMFIATQLTKEANKEKVATRIAEQKYILNNLMNVSSNYQNDEEFKGLFLKLNELKSLFDNLTVRGEDEKIMMDERQLKAITEKTRDLRKEIVG